MKKLYADGYMAIYVEEDERLLYYKIVGYPKFSQIIRNGHDKIFAYVTEMKKSKPVVNLVADLLEAKILLTNDIQWIACTSYPRLFKSGVKNLGILLSEDVHVQMNVEQTLNYMGTSTFRNVRLFDELDKCREWMRTL